MWVDIVQLKDGTLSDVYLLRPKMRMQYLESDPVEHITSVLIMIKGGNLIAEEAAYYFNPGYP